ncbi:MAG: CofH family radical SAM protein, partial [Rikenellaceae bacterium]
MIEEDKRIYDKVRNGERIDAAEALHLYQNTPLFLLASMALDAKRAKSGDAVYYNKNFHVEPTNICCFRCKFCSYRKNEGEDGGWNMSLEEIEEYVKAHLTPETTEVHLVGGVNAQHTLERYCEVIALVRRLVGTKVCIKAFSAIEHIYVIEKAGLSFEEGIKQLIASGMDTITGGGAEIFDESIRSQICSDKASSDSWLRFHATAHRLGIKSNATMLYGHMESVEHRIDHMSRLRNLQDITGGFTTFIPLKFRSQNNSMSYLGESAIIDDMRTIAISRIFLDNFPHIKAYSPMFGKARTQQAILFGADDIDGTV